jgi:DnaJ-class molecular chaperone
MEEKKIFLKTIVQDDDEEEDDDDEYGYCPTCNGSGEGMWDGSSCVVCRGSGELKYNKD